eukprot:COSAG06_NODE_2438_length_6875_cov_7.162633_1_plen_43_part_10
MGEKSRLAHRIDVSCVRLVCELWDPRDVATERKRHLVLSAFPM